MEIKHLLIPIFQFANLFKHLWHDGCDLFKMFNVINDRLLSIM